MDKKIALKPSALSIQWLILLVAVMTLGYSTWRSEVSEYNSTVRAASFETLKALASLQLIVDYTYYDKDETKGDAILGWHHVLMVRDMSQFMHDEQKQSAEKLVEVWQEYSQTLKENKQSEQRITAQISEVRKRVIDGLVMIK